MFPPATQLQSSEAVSVVVLSFNKPSLTKNCLESIDREAAPGVSIYLVDNGGNNQTARELAPLLQRLSSRRQIRNIRLAQNLGFSAGMNAGLFQAFQAGSRWVVALSNDIILGTGFFEALKKGTASAPAASILCPHVKFIKNPLKTAYSHGAVDLSTYTLSHHQDALTPFQIRFPQYYPAAGTIWSAAAYEGLGGFNEKFFCYWEDVELSFRASIKGVDLVFEPGLVIHHLARGTTAGKKIYNLHFDNGKKLLQFLLNNSSEVTHVTK